ncbi:hypothetical protein FOA52_008801 [Chlamydomonas sp. UWO 241]|nr:hypothetical protein FOA52_008801 [Chlamydomonas sp. UWO 241]
MPRRHANERSVSVCTPDRRAQVVGESTGALSCPSRLLACASTASRKAVQHSRSARLPSVPRLGHSTSM